MPADVALLASKLFADLCVHRLRSDRSIGIFAEGLPPLDVAAFLQLVESEIPRLRVALLGGAHVGRRTRPRLALTTDPSIANVWRNDESARTGTRTIVLVVGAAPKLNSLRTAYSRITSVDLRAAAIAHVIALHDSPERRHFWGAMSSHPVAGVLNAVARLERAAATAPTALLSEEPKAVIELELIPSDALFGAGGPSAARRAIRRNRETIERLEGLSQKDRRRLVAMSEQGTPDERKVADALLGFATSRSLEALSNVSHEEVLAALRWQSGDTPTAPAAGGEPETKNRPQRVDGDSLAATLLLEQDGRGLKAAAARFDEAVEPDPDGDTDPDEVQVGTRRIQPRLKAGTTQATALFGQLLSESVWGGIIEASDVTDFVGALKRATSGEADIEEFRPNDEEGVRGMLRRAVETGLAQREALGGWDAFAAARARLLPFVGSLVNHPLLALAGARDLGAAARATLAAYDGAMAAVRDVAQALNEQGSSDPARRLVAKALCIDVVFLQGIDDTVAVVAPTHPFHLWRCLELVGLLQDHRSDLAAVGRETLEPLLTEPGLASPHLVLSPFASTRVRATRAFVAVGSLGSLPLFADPAARQLGSFRVRALGRIADRLLRLMPHASLGLRVALVDPESLAGSLEELTGLDNPLADAGRTPVHVLLLRTRAPRTATEEEDGAVSLLARELHDAGGSLTVEPLISSLAAAADRLAANPVHLAVVFDPGSAQSIRVGLPKPPQLSPLTVPRTYSYDQFDDRLDIILAGESAPFKTYHEMFCRTLDIPRDQFLGRRSGASERSRDLERIAQHSMWTVVIDQAVEPTLRLSGAPRLDWRHDGGRDVITFTAHPEAVEDLVRDAVRVAGLAPTEETVKQTLRQLLELSGESLLALARPRPGLSLAEPRIARAMLGVLAAARWYREHYPDSLLISLDDATSRAWILGHGSDDRHGDLIGLRSSSTGVAIDAVEVKAHDDESAGLRERGTTLEGPAATQVDQTIVVLRDILVPVPGSPVGRARREILRDQLYRAVAARPYERPERARLVSLLEELFGHGPSECSGLIVTVQLAAGQVRSYPATARAFRTPGGNPVGVVQIIEPGENAPRLETRRGGAALPQPSSEPTDPDGPSTRHPESSPVAGPGRSAADHTTPVGEPETRFLVGTSRAGSTVYWDPHNTERPLNNFGFLITGDSGSGKTQLLRALIADTSRTGLPVCVFDYKNDYSSADFATPNDLTVYDVNRDGLPFNPLSLLPDENGEAQPNRQVFELAAILRRIFNLGDQQEAKLKSAMRQAYLLWQIDPARRIRVAPDLPTPKFSEVVAILQADPKADKLLNRLEPLFDLGLFPDSEPPSTFERLLASRVVLNLVGLPDDRIKAAISEFMVVRIHGHVLKGDQPRRLRRLLVFDEAWRIAQSERLHELAREGRAFGVGLALSTQFPGDLPENLAGNLATQLLLLNQNAEHRRSVVRTLQGATTGPAAQQLSRQIGSLQVHEGFLRNQQYVPYVLLETLPYFRRT